MTENIDWHKIFYIKDDVLYNKVERRYNKKDEPAGYVRHDGRVLITYKKKTRYASRIIWEMTNGQIPEGMEIDHINRNKWDDRIENLRLATKTQNQHNRAVHAGKPVKGFSAIRRADGSVVYRPKLKHNRKTHNLGTFNCPTAARVAYMKAKQDLAGVFSPYNEVAA